MNANALRSILLVKNVEEHDPDGVVLPLAERDAATRDALRATPAAAGAGDRAWDVLATRAAQLQDRLAGRHPVVERALDLESALTGAGWLMLPAAFAVGLALSLFDSRVRIEILAFPLLGVVAWNLAVYVLLLLATVRAARNRSAQRQSAIWVWTLWPARWGWRRASQLIKQSSFYHRPLSAALRKFSAEWWPLAQPLLSQQGQRLFHLGSAALALGLVAGFYVRGIALEYRAGWESTFLGAAQVRTLLGWVYGPASVATGIALPADEAAVNALHWRSGQGGGPAAPWIHLMAATAILYVIVPRLLLAVLATARLRRAAASVALPESLLIYARGVLGASDAALPAQVARLTAFAYEPAAASESGLQRLLRATFGADTRIEFAPVLRYGDEAEFETRLRAAVPDVEMLLFSLAATPEAENHGNVLRILHAAHTGADGIRRLVLVDESPFLARMGGDASLAGRIEQRRDAWREFVRSHGFDACLVQLAAIPAAGPVAAADVESARRSCQGRRP
jgi:hypothetical protein